MEGGSAQMKLARSLALSLSLLLYYTFPSGSVPRLPSRVIVLHGVTRAGGRVGTGGCSRRQKETE